MLEKIKEKFLNKSFLSFAFIGAFNTILSQILYMIFVSFSIAVSTSSLLGDIVPMFFSYFLNMHFTYHEKPNWKSFISFPISYLPGIIINMVTLLSSLIGSAYKLRQSCLAADNSNYLTMSLSKLTSNKDKNKVVRPVPVFSGFYKVSLIYDMIYKVIRL
ncbi:MAG: GtrA family protein [Clostridia bacterium]